MPKNNTLEHIFNIARTNEEKGAEFYASLAEKAENLRIKDIFIKLSREELEHKAAFEKIIQMEIGTSSEEMPESENKLLNTIVSAGVFQDLAGGEVLSAIDALAIGIQAEKDSILLYHEIYKQVKSQVAKSMLSILLEEEKMHLVSLREQMDGLQEEIKR